MNCMNPIRFNELTLAFVRIYWIYWGIVLILDFSKTGFEHCGGENSLWQPFYAIRFGA